MRHLHQGQRSSSLSRFSDLLPPSPNSVVVVFPLDLSICTSNYVSSEELSPRKIFYETILPSFFPPLLSRLRCPLLLSVLFKKKSALQECFIIWPKRTVSRVTQAARNRGSSFQNGVKRNPFIVAFSSKLSSLRRKRCLAVFAGDSVCRAVRLRLFVSCAIILKGILENRSRRLTNDWKGESDSFSSPPPPSTNRSKPRTNETKMAFLFCLSFASMIIKRWFFFYIYSFFLFSEVAPDWMETCDPFGFCTISTGPRHKAIHISIYVLCLCTCTRKRDNREGTYIYVQMFTQSEL